MSLTQAEKQRLIAELNRQVADGWREGKLSRVAAIRSAHPDWDYDRAWAAAEHEQQNPAPEPASVSQAVKLIQAEHPGWTFQQSWDFAEATYPALVKGADPLTRDPRISQEMTKIKKLGDVTRSATAGDHAEFLAKVRKLMTEQNLSFDQAFDEIIKREHGTKMTADEPKPSAHVEADGVPEHPFQQEANRRGLLLIEGGFCNPIC